MNAIHPAFGDEPRLGQGYPLLYNVVYCSRAAEGVDEKVVDRIIQTARRVNPEKGITGLLVFGGGIFFQWIEGPRDNVSELIELIKKDHRHTSVIFLTSGEEVRERLFPDWDMELVSATDVRDVLKDAMENVKEAKNKKALEQLLTELDTGQLSSIGGQT